MKILMLGSCIARDLIEIGLNRGLLPTPTCFARSSIASLASLPVVDEMLLSRIKSSYQEQCVRADMDKSFLERLPNEDFDILLIDLAEERFSLLETPDGRLLTLSEEYIAHQHSASLLGKIIEPGSIYYYKKWHQGWYQIETILRLRNFLSKIRILEFFWTNRINNGKLIDSIRDDPFIRQNSLLQSHYDFLRGQLPKECFIRIPTEFLIADENHKWGLSPMHYIPEMMDYALEQLLKSKIL